MNKKQFTTQVHEAEKSLYHIAKSILRNDEDCADAIQNAVLHVNGIRYEDGTVVEEEGFQNTSESWENGIYSKTAKLTTVIDVDKTSALLVGDGMDEIVLR